MSLRIPAIRAAACAAACALGGCATASSSSFTQAPLFFSTADEAPLDGSEEALAPYGTLDRGVANYNLVGGNALLPVRAVSLDAGVQANLLGAPLAAGLSTGQGGALNGEAAASVAGTGVTATLGNGAVTTVLATPGNVNTTTISPNVAIAPSSVPAVSSALITAGPVLGTAAAAAQPVVSNANGLLNATSTDLARLCALRVCR